MKLPDCLRRWIPRLRYHLPDNAPRILVSVDSTWIHRLGLSRFTYDRMIKRAGGKPKRVQYRHYIEDLNDAGDRAAALLDSADGLVLGGGGDVDPTLYDGDDRVIQSASSLKPRRDRFELILLEIAIERGLPVLGVCRGCQLMNAALGGSLMTFRDDTERRRYHNRLRSHPVALDADSYLSHSVGGTRLGGIRSLHGQAVDRPAPHFRIVGRADDGTPEAIEPVDAVTRGRPFCIGVQWHPELMPRLAQEHRLIRDFVNRASATQ